MSRSQNIKWERGQASNEEPAWEVELLDHADYQYNYNSLKLKRQNIIELNLIGLMYR